MGDTHAARTRLLAPALGAAAAAAAAAVAIAVVATGGDGLGSPDARAAISGSSIARIAASSIPRAR